jgi:uracil-DNA glycosylase
LPEVKLTLLIGRYAQQRYLSVGSENLEDTVRRWQDFAAQGFFPLPHPSPRNTKWLRDRPWFESEVLPALRDAVSKALSQ